MKNMKDRKKQKTLNYQRRAKRIKKESEAKEILENDIYDLKRKINNKELVYIEAACKIACESVFSFGGMVLSSLLLLEDGEKSEYLFETILNKIQEQPFHSIIPIVGLCSGLVVSEILNSIIGMKSNEEIKQILNERSELKENLKELEEKYNKKYVDKDFSYNNSVKRYKK